MIENEYKLVFSTNKRHGDIMFRLFYGSHTRKIMIMNQKKTMLMNTNHKINVNSHYNLLILE